MLCHRGPTSNYSALFRCLEVLVCLADRLPYDFQFGTQHLRSFLWVSSDANANWHGVLHGVLCRHTDDLVDFHKKLWTPRESDAVSLPRSLRRARRCRRHHPLGLLSILGGLASECAKTAFRSKVKPFWNRSVAKERTGPGAGRQVDCGVMVPAPTAVHGGAQVSRETTSARDERNYSYKRQADSHGLSSGVVFDTGASSSMSPRRREFLCRFPSPLVWSQKKKVGCSRSSCAFAS